jgi:sugar lactone lactonase YvrE
MISCRSFYVVLILVFTICFSFSCSKSPDSNTPANYNITITSLKPAHGPFDTIDTLTGMNLDKLPSLDSVTINGKKLTIISRSAERIIVQIPSFAGTGNVSVWYNGKLIEGPVFRYDSIFLVTTIAGTSNPAEMDGKGLGAGFYYPKGIAVDHSGNIYIAEMGGSNIRKIDTAMNVTTLAGPSNLQGGFADGTGSAAMFAAPVGLCIDQSGNLYVGDQFNYKVRKVSPTGVVTTFAGVAYNSYPNLGATDGPISVATFNTPYTVACDNSGNVYVADEYNNKIRKITAGIVSSLAGGDYYHYGTQDGQGSSALFYSPNAVAVDPSDNVYVVDNDDHLIRKITSDGTVTTILGPIEPGITGPYDPMSVSALATDKSGNLFFSVLGGIFERTPGGSIIRYAAGGVGESDGPIAIATFRAISGIAIDDNGNLFITDNNRIRRIGWQ